MEGPNESKQVAEFDAKGITFTTDFNDIVFDDEEQEEGSFSEENPMVIDAEKSSETEEKEEQEEQEEGQEEEQEEVVTDEKEVDQEQDPSDVYADYTEYALVALNKVRSGEWDLDEKDIPKDMDILTFDELISKNEELRLEEMKRQLVSATNEAQKYVEFLLNGGDANVIQDALQFSDYTRLDPTDEKDQVTLLTEFYRQKQVPEEDIPDIIESAQDKGKGEERAKEALKLFKDYEDKVIQESNKRREEQEKQNQKIFQEYKESVHSVVESGEISGYKVSKKQQKEILAAMFDPTEVIEYRDNTGRVVTQKATKAQKLMQTLNSDPEKQAAFVLWMLEGGKFDFVKDQASVEHSDSLRDVLERRTQITKKNRSRPSKDNKTENAFEILARKVAEIDRR